MECLEDWQAAASSRGFPTVELRRLQVSPVQRDGDAPPGRLQMKLLEGEGWGDGEHPSTWLCLDFLESVMKGGFPKGVWLGRGGGGREDGRQGADACQVKPTGVGLFAGSRRGYVR